MQAIHKKGCNMLPTCCIIFQRSLRDVQQILNSTEGNFHQLVALLNCRGLNKVTIATYSPSQPDWKCVIELICLLFRSILYFSPHVLVSQDYVDSLKGLCYDGMEGLLYLSLYSFLSALAFTAILCSLPGAWRSFHRCISSLHIFQHPICCTVYTGVAFFIIVTAFTVLFWRYCQNKISETL